MSRFLLPCLHAKGLAGILRRSLLMLAAAGGGLLLVTPSASSQNAGMKLQQGIDVIRQVLAHDGLYSRTTTTGTNNYKSHVEKHYALAQSDGCRLTVVSDSHSHTEMPEHNQVIDRSSSDTWRTDFSLLDPATVYVGDPQPPQPNWQAKGYLVRIAVQPGKPLIVASTLDKETNAARDLPPLPTLAVYVSSREAADRLAKAFSQVATSCRANPSGK